MQSPETSTISAEVLAVLACPADHAALTHNEASHTLTCTKCGKTYSIVKGIPNFLQGK